MTKIGNNESYSREGPECPYCGHTITPDDPCFYSDNYTEETCPDCDKKFNVEVYHSVSWTCQAIEDTDACQQDVSP